MDIKAKFIGKDGSLGYRKGQIYSLIFKTVDDDRQSGCDHLIRISKINEEMPCISTNVVLYSSLNSFLKNWSPL